MLGRPERPPPILLQTGQDLLPGEFCWHDLRQVKQHTLMTSILASGVEHLSALDHLKSHHMLGSLSAKVIRKTVCLTSYVLTQQT